MPKIWHTWAKPSSAACAVAYTRLTSGHSKKIDNHVHVVALYTCWYNFARINSAVRMSSAMTARLETLLWDIADIVKLIEEWENDSAVAGAA